MGVSVEGGTSTKPEPQAWGERRSMRPVCECRYCLEEGVVGVQRR